MRHVHQEEGAYGIGHFADAGEVDDARVGAGARDDHLRLVLVGQTLHTSRAEVYRTLIEGSAFGARIIMERFEEYGVSVKEVINCGGIAEKSPLVMQIYADVTGRPMKISRSAQTCRGN